MKYFKALTGFLKTTSPQARGIGAFLFLFYSVALYYLLHWPIIGLDTDLWYHLNAGRYILGHLSLPHFSFFSFITPARTYIDYYWLFQVVIFQIYSLFQYYGLIFFRAMVYLATVTLLLIYLLKRRESDQPAVYLVFLFILYALFLFPRFELIRPHVFSYFLIILFLYILEFQPRRVILLPFLAVFWSNVHGVEYPVMILILMAYIFEFFLNHIRQRAHVQKEELPYILPLVFSLGAIFITPHGWSLTTVPFISIQGASQYIKEFQSLKVDDLLTFRWTLIPSSLATVLNFLLIFTIISLALSVWKKKFRVSHLLLLVGGVVLLVKGVRFTYEFILLALPTLKAQPLSVSSPLQSKKNRRVIASVAALVLLFCLYNFRCFFINPPRFPFSSNRLPQGVVSFLNHIPAKGSILNHPNNGGYLQWMLYPRYKIFMDMEVPFLFKDEDFLLANDALDNDEVLKKFLLKYDPSFITVPISKTTFKERIKKFPAYCLVFFDSSEVLYLNRKHYPDLAAEYDLGDLDPYVFYDRSVDLILGQEKRLINFKKISRMVELYPDCLLTNQLLAMVHNKTGEYRKAMTYENAVIKNFPENPIGYLLIGDSLRGLNRPDGAIASYKLALDRAQGAEKMKIYRHTALAYIARKEYPAAYKSFRKGLNIFAPETTYQELFDFGSTALLSGKIDEAVRIWRFAYLKVPLENKEWQDRIGKQLSRLGVHEKD